MEVFLAINWNVSPEIFSIGPIHVRWYGVLFALSFIIGYQILSNIFKREGKSPKDLEGLTISLILGTVIGARLGHCLFYEPQYYLNNPIEILKIWHGGLASHGAAIGNLIAVIIFVNRHKHISFMWVLDRASIVIPIGAFMIRLGNFFNSEIVGKPTDVPWAVVFTRLDNIPRHPSQLYEGIVYLAIFIFMLVSYYRSNVNIPPGRYIGYLLTFLFTARFFIEFTKENQSAFEAHLILNMGQLLSIPFIILGLYFIINSFKYQGKEN